MAPKKILLAEDDADDSDFFCDFAKTRADVALLPVAQNGEEVFELVRARPQNLPDFIILDQNMPKRSGLQTLQLLKENNRYKNIPVFVYSTYADEALHQQSMAAGATAVFSKPYTMEGYAQMLAAMLRLIEK